MIFRPRPSLTPLNMLNCRAMDLHGHSPHHQLVNGTASDPLPSVGGSRIVVRLLYATSGAASHTCDRQHVEQSIEPRAGVTDQVEMEKVRTMRASYHLRGR